MPIGRSSIGQQITKPGKKKKKISFQSILRKNRGGKKTGTKSKGKL